jgi:murein DD-endopeptidase MepM/ murein hydrolase activator NlpD
MALSAVAGRLWELAAASWRVLVVVTAGAVLALACAAAFSRIPRRSPAIELAPAASLDTVLLEGRLPEPSSADAAITAAVVRILKVRQHQVQAGETLSEIAGRYSLRLGTIIAFNGIADARSVSAGKTLSIPNADGLLYRVKRGDSLGKIATSYRVTPNALMDWNDLQSAVIKPGDRLFVPGAALSDDEIGAVLGKLFIYPTTGELTSGFGNRMSPIYKQILFHNGIDLHNRTGTPVVASRAGRVVSVDMGHPVYGKTVILAHSGGYQTMYAHLDTILVRRGQTVSQGAQLGTMGSTGATTGPHLHFSVFKNSEPIDPLKVLH